MSRGIGKLHQILTFARSLTKTSRTFDQPKNRASWPGTRGRKRLWDLVPEPAGAEEHPGVVDLAAELNLALAVQQAGVLAPFAHVVRVLEHFLEPLTAHLVRNHPEHCHLPLSL